MCLASHHSPGSLELSVTSDDGETGVALEWDAPSDEALRSHANELDATENGAYCLVLAVIEELLGLVTLGRTVTRSGADWWVIPLAGLDADTSFDLDRADAVRLEVSGVRTDSASILRARLRDKIDQLRAASEIPGLAGVVGFLSASVLVEEMHAGD